jgi:hypothetical protein
MSTPRDPVQFTRESADRIAGVVRTLELTPASGAPLNFQAVIPGNASKVFRVASFTAVWNTGTEQVVTLVNQTSTPNTVSATNLLYRVEPLSSTEPQVCVIAKEGSAWYYVNTQDVGGEEVRRATFSGDWAKGASKTITFASGSTANATNILHNVKVSGTRQCIVAPREGSWEFVNEAQVCTTGKDKFSAATEEQTLEENTTGLKALITSSSGDCMKWVDLVAITVVTGMQWTDNGSGPVLRASVCKVWVPSFGLPGSTFFQNNGAGFVDVAVPVLGCEVE